MTVAVTQIPPEMTYIDVLRSSLAKELLVPTIAALMAWAAFTDTKTLLQTWR
jgi:hypothetical protein